MATTETLLTELEAINIMLDALGEAPVNSLTGTLPVDVALAQNVLHEQRKAIQSLGWYFNSEEQVTITLDGNGNASLPPNVLKLELYQPDGSVDVVLRGTKLYDRQNHTYVFKAAPICNITYLLTWDEQPQQLRHYIAIKAARINQQRRIGSRELDGFRAEDEMRHQGIWLQTDCDMAQYNVFNNYDGARFYQYRRQ